MTTSESPRGSREIYGSVELESWVERIGLEPSEAYLLRNFLKSDAHTVEAGTGGGRILFGLGELGFRKLHGFDFVPGMVRAARTRDRHRFLKLSVQDATQLAYGDESFDQIIYLQQIISLIESPEGRRRAMTEAFRILKPGGPALFSFLAHESRSQIPIYRAFRNYLRLLRFVCGVRRDIQTWPWLKLGGRFNRRALWDSGPYVRWFRAEEAISELSAAGFRIRFIASAHQLEDGRLCSSSDELLKEPLRGAIYCVCYKE
ncbi:MAG: class I SAM-dependent methyltransferase [Planctomycetes bacterium]|nr:class I SAM-dependent methyltransferase [Planctomycetota bacterium]